MVNQKRIRHLNKIDQIGDGPVVYWMSRDQRARDNWALLYAQELATKRKAPLLVVFCLAPQFLQATIRQYDFMLRGLEEVEQNLIKKNIPFYLLSGDPVKELIKFLNKQKASVLITDFDPLNIKNKWKKGVAKNIKIPFYEVDAHNIVPCFYASDKQEYAAYTFRPKIKKQLSEFLTKYPYFVKHKYAGKKIKAINWQKIKNQLKVDNTVPEIDWLKPGEKAAKRILRKFIKDKLKLYSKYKNDPNKNVLSDFSPYLHFGHLSAQKAAWEIQKSSALKKDKEVFLEELIVRKELSDNYCFYNDNYDSWSGLPQWSKETLKKHNKDKRPYSYSLSKLEQVRTHDDLWNAAQIEMVKTGKMHGYMRMYWAKKILEWSSSSRKAIKNAIYLNNKYELDGRDPNGYVGVLWSVGGLHDRPWPERKIFGKVRYMNYDGCKRKFDVKKYIQKFKRINSS